MSQSASVLTYHEFKTPSEVPFLVIDHRDNRFPISKIRVTAAGVIEMVAADGLIEAIGTMQVPCSSPVLSRIRTHHEGVLLVQVDPARGTDGLAEQMLSARLL